jgi:L-asparagine transporter-like permease
MTWAGTALNVVLISAILSTMLAAMFGLGRMMRSLVDEGLAPRWLKDERDVPYRGILTSGFAMLISLGVGLLFPSAYLFLISSGGFAILFSYAVIMATHIRFRRKNGCPPDGKCQMWGVPYTSLFVLIALIVSIFSMLFVSGQASGFIAGCIVIAFYIICYSVLRLYNRRENAIRPNLHKKIDMTAEISKELNDFNKNDTNDKH